MTVKGKTLRILNCRVHADKVFITLERVTKRTTANKLKDEFVFVTRDQASQLEEDEFYIVDLIGAKVVSPDEELIGTLVDVKQTGVVDNFEIKIGDNKTVLVPALHEYFEIVDESKIYADFPEEFFELWSFISLHSFQKSLIPT